jgi:hypothetical protein
MWPHGSTLAWKFEALSSIPSAEKKKRKEKDIKKENHWDKLPKN